MSDKWIDKLNQIKTNRHLNGISELIHKVGNLRSARSTVYQLSKKYPDFLWSHEGDTVRAVLPKAESIQDKAVKKWKDGARRLDKPDTWPPLPQFFEGDVYEDCLEELADLHNYIYVSFAKKQISEHNKKYLLMKTTELYNLVRRAHEFNGQSLR